MAHRHGDPTPQRCVFLVAVLPECIIDGKDASGFFSVEGTSLSSVAVESCFDDEPSHGMLHPPRPQDVPALPERDAEGYDGPRLVGTIGIGGMGWSVYDGSKNGDGADLGSRTRRSNSTLQGLFNGTHSPAVTMGGASGALVSRRVRRVPAAPT